MPGFPRSRWEAGDPVYDAIAAVERRDHAWAKARGARIADLAQSVVSVLVARGLLADPETARVLVASVLADSLVGNRAIDLPELRKGEDA